MTGRGGRESEFSLSPSPRILRRSLLAGARRAEGLVVVIDVYRAFTSAAFMIHLGASQIILEADAEAVLRLKRETGCLAVGEVGGRPVPGFDFGNSPARILAAGSEAFQARVVALRTSAGVTGAVTAGQKADAVILGSYVTASAIVAYIHTLTPLPKVVSVVPMGNAGREVSPEDEACADYMEHLLTGQPYSHADALQGILAHESTLKFLRGDQVHFPPADPILCLQRDLFGFALVASWENGQLVARPIAVPGSRQA